MSKDDTPRKDESRVESPSAAELAAAADAMRLETESAGEEHLDAAPKDHVEEHAEEHADEHADEDHEERETPRGLTLPAHDEDDDELPVRVMGSSARAEKEKRRTQFLVRGRREPAQATIASDVSREGKLILYVLNELSDEERDSVRAEIHDDEAVSHRLGVIRRHLEIHQSLPPVRAAAGSFLRLTQRMKEEGHLSYAYPGWHSIWRRSFSYGVAAAIILALLMSFKFFSGPVQSKAGVPFGAFTQLLEDGEGESRAVSLNTPLSTGSEGGYLWLSTQRSGIATEITCDGVASFMLETRSLLKLSSGALSRVQVRSEALYKQGFQIDTAHATIRTYDGEFSVEAQSGRTIVNVARGRVEVQRNNSSEMRMVPEGMCAELSENELVPRLYSFLRIDIQPSKQDRVALVSIVNLSRHEIALRTIAHNFGEAYSGKLVKDLQSGDGVQIAYEGRISLAPQYDTARGSRLLPDGWVVLEPSGKADKYQFVADLTAETLGWFARDMGFSVEYHDILRSDTFGEMNFPVMSPVRRMNLKDNDLTDVD